MPLNLPSDPLELFTQINSLPPLMRADAANAYVGTMVEWNLIFVDGDETVSGRARLVFRSGATGVRMIMTDASLEDYPYLRSLPSGEAVRVRGRIRNIDALCINLDLTELVLPKAAEAAHCPPRRS